MAGTDYSVIVAGVDLFDASMVLLQVALTLATAKAVYKGARMILALLGSDK